MRAVFVGAGSVTTAATRMLLARRHEVVVIERDRARIDALEIDLECGFIHGDGTKPAILREAEPASTDVLFCLTHDDRSNILASLVGRSLGFRRIVTKIDDPEFEHICVELGLEDAIVPSQTIGRCLADMLEGHNPMQLGAVLRGNARAFSFLAGPHDEGTVDDLSLPEACRAICLYREERFVIVDGRTPVHAGDEVVLLTHSRNLDRLRERWSVPPEAGARDHGLSDPLP